MMNEDIPAYGGGSGMVSGMSFNPTGVVEKTSSNQVGGMDVGEMLPSKLQQYVSELFRITLCRNDDLNLALSSVLKRAKRKVENKEKIITDMGNREEER